MEKKKTTFLGETGEVFAPQLSKVTNDGDSHYSVGIAIDGLTPEDDGSFFAVFTAEEARQLGYSLVRSANDAELINIV